MFHNIFRTTKPIIAMVHLQYKGDLNRLIDEAMQDIEKLQRGGVDGLLFENWGEEYTNRRVPQDVRRYTTAVMAEASKDTNLPYGVNVLPLDYEASFDIAKETKARFVQVDTFVDTVRTDYSNRFIIRINPKEVIDYRRKLGLNDVILLANIQTKHYSTIPPNKKLETSAIKAVENGADALVVTGKSTGKKTPKEKLIRVKRVADDTPVGIGSGFNVYNAAELMPYADFVIVRSSLNYGGITENPVDEERVKRLMDVVYRFR